MRAAVIGAGAEGTANGLGPRLARKIEAMVGGLIESHFPEIEETWDKAEDGKMSLSAKVSIEGSPRKAVVGVKLSWSQKLEAEVEGFLDDPDQRQLPMGENA
ncbi:MAG: hypothetical protein BWZ08_02856 [candidate division BRC1 bacterium ADurb.BinA292]|nr:MAG: hypothetical protein BWZ08_02856 [candidate division BRC1 bacterium ADurb.BinA292]